MATYNDIINSSSLVLVEFYANWCPHCQRMMPVVEEVKGELKGRCNVFQFEIDENRSLAEENNVESIPTFILYKNGEEIWRKSGEMTLCQLLGLIEENM